MRLLTVLEVCPLQMVARSSLLFGLFTRNSLQDSLETYGILQLHI